MELVQPQLAQLQPQPPVGDNWIHEIKFDGYRTLAYIEKGKVTLRTRSGLNWTEKYPSIATALAKLKLKDTVLDGEICFVDNDGKSDFQMLQNSLKYHRPENLVYFVFDVLEHNGKDFREHDQLSRKAELEKLLKKAPSEIRFAEHWSIDSKQLLSASCELGLEGLISKRIDATYESGRNKNWIKSKCTKAQEFVVIGYTEPKHTRSGFGSLLLGAYDKGKLVYVGRVGTGFTRASIEELLKKMKRLRQTESPVAEHPPRSRSITWLKPKLVAQVNFTEWTSEGSLRHPSFQGLRDDKPAKKVHLETTRPQLAT